MTTLTGHTDAVTSAVFSPDGTQILTASADGTARLWDTNGRVIAMLIGHTEGVIGAVFSLDGTQIVTVSADGTARLWRSDGTLIAALVGHTDTVRSAVFSPDGSQILTASNDNTARIYLANTDDLLKVAACRVGRGLTEDEKLQFLIPNPKFVYAERQCPAKLSWQK